MTAKIKGNLGRVNKGELSEALKDYLDIALLQLVQTKSQIAAPDKNFISNEDFWTTSIENELYAGQVITLKNFCILEWIPSSPGLFHTPHASSLRRAALDSYWRGRPIEERQKINKAIELRPNEKMGMVLGGYGSLRIAPKVINNELQYILCASSSGVSHEGIPITLKRTHYDQVVEELKSGKVPVANITGRLMIVPKELSLIKLKYHEDVPKFYLDVEDFSIAKSKRKEQGIISVAITYSRVKDFLKSSSFSYSFCSFAHTKNNSDLKEAVDWLQGYAKRYSHDKNPIIMGDFDEEFEHFDDVEFPLKNIANGKIPMDKLIHLKELFQFQIRELYMGDKNVFNKSQIGAVGSNATATKNTFQQANYSLPENFDYQKLDEQLALLRENLLQSAKTPEEFKAIGEVAAAEIASKEKNANGVVQHLKNAGKWVLDTATKIGVNVVTELIKHQINSPS